MPRPAIAFLLVLQFIFAFAIPPANAQEASGAQPSTGSVDLNLTSTDKSVSAASVLQSDTQATINLASMTRTVGVSDMLTPAEMVAVRQVLNTGQQYLQLNDLGAAVGGGLRLNYYAANGVSNLVIPENVRASQNAALLQSLNVSGNLTNSGTFNVYSSNAAVSAATVNAANIYNNAGAVIASTLANLNLNAVNNIVNAGTISSSGNLNLTAGNSIVNAGSAAMMAMMQANNISMVANNIVNSGTIQAMTGNLNIASQMAQNLSVNNMGGILQALNGNINMRDSSYSGPGNISLMGGDYLSRQLNLYAGTGTALVNVGQVAGVVNTYAGAEHISADTTLLQLGNNISSDPTYYNSGSIQIVGTVSSNEGLAIVAGGDITADINGRIVTNGNNLLMIAGANITSACTGCTLPGPGTVGPTSGGTPTSGLAEGPVTVSLTGGAGGNIDLSGSLAEKVIDTSSSTSSGGNVTMVALADAFGVKGTVSLNSFCFFSDCIGVINTSGGGAGGGGNVTIYAGSSSLSPVTSISTNKIVTTSNGTLNSGYVTLRTTQAVTSDLQPLVLNAQGAITSGNTIQPGATLALAGISTGNISTVVNGGSQAGGNVTISAYGDIDTSRGPIATINNGVGAAGEVTITSSNGSVSTGEIASFVYSGWLAAANVTISAYGNITTNGNLIYAFQGGSGAGGTITLTSTNGTVSTGVLLTGVGDTVAAGNVIISAYGNITTGDIAAFNVGTGGGGTVTLTSSNGAILTGLIATNTNLGMVSAGNVMLSAYGDITVLGKIDASNAGISTGGSVTLLTLGSLTTGDIDTSTSGSLGGSITAAAAGNNGSYSIAMGNLNTSGSAAAGFVEVVSTDLLEKSNLIGTITAQASGQSGVGGSVGIATRGTLAVGNIDTTNTSASAISGAQSGSVFLSSGATSGSAILAGDIKAYNTVNGSATGQVILIASGTIGVLGTITTFAGNSSVNQSYTSLTSSISSSTTIDVSVNGISGLFSNYNPQGYLFMSGGSTQLTIDSGGNSSLLAPLLVLGAVSIDSINSNSGTQADGVALAAFGNITLSGVAGVSTGGTTSGGNGHLLSITGQISVNGLATSSSGAGTAGNVSVSAAGFINVGGTINASNSGTGAGGTVTLMSSTSSVSVGRIDTYVSGSAAAAGSVIISAFGDINTNNNAINAHNAGTGSGGTVFLVSSTGSVSAGEIDTYVSSGTAIAGSVAIAAYGSIDTHGNSITAYNGGSGSSGSVILISSNSFITTGAIDTHVTSGSEKAADVTVSAYGAINLTGLLNAANAGSGSGSTVNLLSANGSVTTGGINVNVSTASIVAGNVNIEASGAIDTSAGAIQAKNGGTRPIDSGVTLLSHTSSVTTGGIDISVTGGSALAGNVSISAPQSITVIGEINASNSGTGGGGTVILESLGNSVAVSQVDTHVNSSSAQAGSVSVSAFGFISASGAINAYNAGIGGGSSGAAGTVALISTSSVTTVGINTYVTGGSATAGNVTILADAAINATGVINTYNAGSGAGGAIALTSGSGAVSVGGVQTYVGGGSAAAGNLIISAPGAISISGAIATNNTATGAGGSVALISSSTISLSTITTSGAPSGSVFLSSGFGGLGAIVTGAITLAGGALLATAADSGSIVVQSFTEGNTLSVDYGHIYATGTYTIAVNILPQSFINSATATITPAIIPGGGFASFNNTGTVTLANDAGSSGNVITFSDLLPVFVQGAVTSLGTINDSTGRANFFVVAPTVSVSSATGYTSAAGSLGVLANQMTLAAINTNGANLNLTAVQAMTTGIINTINSGGTKAGNATLLSAVSSVTTGAIATSVTSGSAGSGNVTISAYGAISTNQQTINASNSGTGAGGTINFTTSGAGSVEIGQINTSINNASSNAAAGNITILAAAAIDTNGQAINASNSGTGIGGTVTLTSETFSITTSDIDTHVASGSAPAGNVFVSALQSIITGNINASHAGSGTGGSVTLVRAAAMATANVDTSSTGSAGGSIIAGAVGDNNEYTLSMGNLKTSGLNAAGSVMLVGDDFGAKPLKVGTITAQASGSSGVGGAVGISGLGTVEVGNIDTTNTAAVAVSGAQSGSVFLSSGSKANNAVLAGTINAHNSTNGSASGQVILIASGTIATSGAITTSAGTIAANTFTSNVVSGSVASITPNYTSDILAINSSITVNVSVTGISGPSSNYNPSGYAALSGSDTVLTIDSGGNSLLLAPLVFTAFVPMTIKSINSNSHTAADSIALLVFGNLTLTDAVGIDAHGTISGGSVTIQSSAGQISATSIQTYSSGAGAAGSINISAWAAIPVTGTINASNSGTGAGGAVFLASTDNSVATGAIDTSVAGGSASAGNVTIMAYQAMSTQDIYATNSGTGAGGTVFLTSSNSSVTTGAINTYADSGAAGNVYISAYGAININGNGIQTYNTGAAAGAVSLMSTNGNVSATTSTGFLTVNAFGSAYINQTGAFTLLDSQVGGDFQLNSSGSTTLNSLASLTGSIRIGAPTIILGNNSLIDGNASDIVFDSGDEYSSLTVVLPSSGTAQLLTTGDITFRPTPGHDLIFSSSGASLATLESASGLLKLEVYAARFHIESNASVKHQGPVEVVHNTQGGIIGLDFQPYVGTYGPNPTDPVVSNALSLFGTSDPNSQLNYWGTWTSLNDIEDLMVNVAEFGQLMTYGMGTNFSSTYNTASTPYNAQDAAIVPVVSPWIPGAVYYGAFPGAPAGTRYDGTSSTGPSAGQTDGNGYPSGGQSQAFIVTANYFNVRAAASKGLTVSATVDVAPIVPNDDAAGLHLDVMYAEFNQALSLAQKYPGTVKDIVIGNEWVMQTDTGGTITSTTLDQVNTFFGWAKTERDNAGFQGTDPTQQNYLPITTKERWNVLAGVNNTTPGYAAVQQGLVTLLTQNVEGHVYGDMYAYFDGNMNLASDAVPLGSGLPGTPVSRFTFKNLVTGSMSGSLDAWTTAFSAQGVTVEKRIGETGWPIYGERKPGSGGTGNSGGVPSWGNADFAKWYYDAMVSWTASPPSVPNGQALDPIKTYYFAAYSEPWKAPNPTANPPATTPGSSEAYFGLFTANGTFVPAGPPTNGQAPYNSPGFVMSGQTPNFTFSPPTIASERIAQIDGLLSGTSVNLNTSNLVVNGTVEATAGNLAIQSTASNQSLNVAMGYGSLLNAPSGNVTFNNTLPGRISIIGGPSSGVIQALNNVHFNGGTQSVNVNVFAIYGNVTGIGSPYLISTFHPVPPTPGVPDMATNPFTLVSLINSDLDVLNAQDSSAVQQVQNSNINFFQAGAQVTQDIQWASHNSASNNVNTDTMMGGSITSGSATQAVPIDDQALGQNFAYCNAGDFNSASVGQMQSHGASIGSQTVGNLCVLQQGNFLFQPQSDITVQVQEGSVEIPNGASVLVMETGNDVAVFDISDGPKARVRVKSGNKIITMSPGRQVVLTRQLNADFDKINPSKLIGYKNPKGELVASDIRAYSADFSLPSVMMSVAPMKRMLTSDSPADRKMVQRMIKQAVVLSMLPSKAGPFKTSGSH